MRMGSADPPSRIRRPSAGWAVALLFTIVAFGPARAQNLLQTLRLLGRDAGQHYLDPVVSSFGAAQAAGWFYSPPETSRPGLTIDFGLVSTGGLFFGAPRHFSSAGSFNFNRLQALLLASAAYEDLEQDPRVASLSDAQRQALLDSILVRISGPDIAVTIRGPTAIGPEGDSLRIHFQGLAIPVTVPPSQAGGQAFDTTLDIAPRQVAVPVEATLESLPFLPLLAPQAAVGTFWGTKALLRWIPPVELAEDVGKLSLLGLGVQHNFAVWMGQAAPLDLTLDLHWQRLEVEDAFSVRTASGGLVASKTLGSRAFKFTPFGGAAWERSTLDAEYHYVLERPGGDERRIVEFSLDGSNDFRFTLGLAIRLFFLNLAGEYNFADYGSFSAGMMVML